MPILIERLMTVLTGRGRELLAQVPVQHRSLRGLSAEEIREWYRYTMGRER